MRWLTGWIEEGERTDFLLCDDNLRGYAPVPSDDLFLRLYGPRLMPFLRSLRWPSIQVFDMPYLMQRSHGRLSSHRLQAAAQFVHWIKK